MSNYNLKYKVSALDEVFGNEKLVKEWENRFEKKDFSPVTYIYGESGHGKSAFGDIVAKALTCTNPDIKGQPCNECNNCKDIINGIYKRAVDRRNSSQLNLEQVVNIEKDLLLVNRYSKNKVFIFNEFQEMFKSPAAVGALFDMLERPYDNVYFILITMDDTFITDMNRRKALKRRTNFCHLKKVPPEQLLVLLCKIYEVEKGNYPNTEIQKLISSVVYYAEGSIGVAIPILEKLIYADIQTEDELLEELNIVSENKLFYALTHLVNGDAKSFFTCIPDVNEEMFLRLRSILLDLQLYKSGVDIRSSRERMLNTIKNCDIQLSNILDLMFSNHYLYKTEMKYILIKILNMNKNNTNSTDGSGKKVRRIVNS